MALPSFSKTGLTTVSFSRSYLPSSGRRQPVPRQRVGRSDGGTYEVLTLGPPDVQVQLEFRLLPLADVEALDTFLGTAGVNFSEDTFTFTDTDASTTTVRLLDYAATPVTPQAYDVTIHLVEEPA
jgi:hypothetical protein